MAKKIVATDSPSKRIRDVGSASPRIDPVRREESLRRTGGEAPPARAAMLAMIGWCIRLELQAGEDHADMRHQRDQDDENKRKQREQSVT